MQNQCALKSILSFCFVMMLMLLSHSALAGTINLAWDASTSPNVGGYIVSYGNTSKSYSFNVDVGNKTAYQLTGLQDGSTYFFAVKAYNTTKTIQSAYSNEISAKIAPAVALSVDFTADTTSGTDSLVVSLKGTATGTINSWQWNFGDASLAAANTQNAVVTYNNPGTYSVSLTVTDTSGKSLTVTKSNFITVLASPPVANFTSSATSGYAPLIVTFNDTSTGNITGRTWDFGDGTTSAAISPSHTYNTVGTFSVSLTVTGAGGSNTKTSTNLITVSTTPTNTGTGSQLPNGLVAAYAFDEVGGSAAADVSGNGNHGYIKGPIRSTGVFGQALIFDGIDDWVAVNDSISLDLSTDLTLEAWVYPQAIQTSSIISKEMNGGTVYDMYAYQSSDIPAASFYDGLSYKTVRGNSQLPLNQWSHIATTYDGTKQRFYVNGVQVGVFTSSYTLKKSNLKMRIGGNGISGDFFKGAIDEVRIYNRALTGTEILADMGNSISSNAPTSYTFGNNIIEDQIVTIPQGNAVAYQAITSNTNVTTQLNIYLDATTLATDVKIGIYNDNKGHPGSILAKADLINPKSGVNTVTVPAVKLTAGKPYWLAVVGVNGNISLRGRANANAALMETTASSTLKILPGNWSSGSTMNDGPFSMFGLGYN
jgi:PKD repeat protein